jgi:hypothetical protein
MELAKRHLMIAEVERQRQEGLALDEVLRRLRERGCSKGQSVAVLAGLRELGPSLSSRLLQAKRLVHESPVWADAKERDEQIFDC